MKEAIALLEKAFKALSNYQEPPVIRAGEHPLKVVYDNLYQALSILKQPKCKTCGDERRIQNPEYQPPRFLDKGETYTTPAFILCPDCQQPKAQPTSIGNTLRSIADNKILCETDENIIRQAADRLDVWWGYIGELKSQIPKAQPTEFTKECRELRKRGATAGQWEYAEKMMEACERLDTSEASRKELLEACEWSLEIIKTVKNAVNITLSKFSVSPLPKPPIEKIESAISNAKAE